MMKDHKQIRLDLLNHCLDNETEKFEEIFSNNSNNTVLFTEPYEIHFKEDMQRAACNFQSTTTLLLIACIKDNLSIIKTLINGCNINLETLTNSKEHEARDYITFKKNFNNSGNQWNYNLKATVLWHACRSSNLQVVKLLVENGANVNADTETLFNSTPLM